MIAFIDDHREAYGVEPICRVLPIAPSSYFERVAQRNDPARLSARAKRDLELKPEVACVFAENYEVYGVRKVWRQMRREGIMVARCTVERLMRSLGLHGVIRGKPVRTTVSDKGGALPARSREPAIPRTSPQPPLGFGFHVCRHLAGLCLRGFRHRHLCPTDRRLARQSNGPCQLRTRCIGAGDL